MQQGSSHSLHIFSAGLLAGFAYYAFTQPLKMSREFIGANIISCITSQGTTDSGKKRKKKEKKGGILQPLVSITTE